MKRTLIGCVLLLMLAGCVTAPPPPVWNRVTQATEDEYLEYLKSGTASLSGQAFLVKRNGDVVKAAGMRVTLDPATAVGKEWWEKSGTIWINREHLPVSPNFSSARRTTIADADGRFKFADLPGGAYFVRTEVTWEVPGQYGLYIQGGAVGRAVEVKPAIANDVIMNQIAQ